jgi:pyruvate formate lyase activating enzyme
MSGTTGLEGKMPEALLYDRMDDGSVVCRLCPWKCQIAPGESGRCAVRQNREGTLYSLNYGFLAAAAIEPVERRGLYHLFPGSVILTLGGWGNSLCYRHQPPPPALPPEGKKRYLDPERAITFAAERHCRGLAWGYQEPTVWLEYVLDSAKLARANGLFTLLLTNGFVTMETLDLLGPYLNAYATEIPAATPEPYEALGPVPFWEAILKGAAYVRERWRCHAEIHTPVIPGTNDSDEVIRGLAVWIRDSLGPDTPWHLWRYEPAGELAGRPPTSPAALEKAREVGRETGLHYIYVQSGDESSLTSTQCPSCGSLLVRREGKFSIKVVGLEGSKCSRCGQEIYLQRSIFK